MELNTIYGKCGGSTTFEACAVGISSDFISYCHRFEQIDGLTLQRTSVVWSSFIVEVFGMISKSLLQHANRPVDPTGVNSFYILHHIVSRKL